MKRIALSVASLFLVLVVLSAACSPKVAPATSGQELAASGPEAAWKQVEEAARREGKVTIYSFTFSGDKGKAIAQAFREKYGIVVELLTGPGALLVERIKSEQKGGVYNADLNEGLSTNLLLLKDSNLSDAIGDIPVLKQTGIWRVEAKYDADGHIYRHTPLILPFFYNANAVKAGEEPKSYRDLLAPRWKGKLSFADPTTIPTPDLWRVTLLNHKAIDEAFFAELGKQDIVLSAETRKEVETIVKGEADIVGPLNAENFIPYVKAGSPVRPLDFKEGLVAVNQGIILVKNAPHPNAARLFVNWLLSKDGHEQMVKSREIMGLRKDVPDYTYGALRMEPKTVIAATLEDDRQASENFKNRVVAKLWKR